MRVLLCKSKANLYYQSPNRWVAEAAAADDFRSSLEAALFARENELRNVEVLLDFDDIEYNVRLPVPLHSRLRQPEEPSRNGSIPVRAERLKAA